MKNIVPHNRIAHFVTELFEAQDVQLERDESDGEFTLEVSGDPAG
jgi:hypothetical protein